MDPAGTGWNYLAASDFPRDITILASNIKTIFEDGSNADITNGVYNHHLVFADISKSLPDIISCDGKPVIPPSPLSTFTGASNDGGSAIYTTPDGTFNSGYYIGKDDKILIAGDVVNYRNYSQNVYTLSEIEYVEGDVPNAMDASVQILSVGQCEGGTGIIQPPKDQTKFGLSGKEMTVTKNGYWIRAQGHLHDGGVNLLFKVNGKEICNSRAVYGGAVTKNTWQTIDHMEECLGRIKLVKGDKISLEAYYDLDVHPARKHFGGAMAEEMALLAGSFAIMVDGNEDGYFLTERDLLYCLYGLSMSEVPNIKSLIKGPINPAYASPLTSIKAALIRFHLSLSRSRPGIRNIRASRNRPI